MWGVGYLVSIACINSHSVLGCIWAYEVRYRYDARLTDSPGVERNDAFAAKCTPKDALIDDLSSPCRSSQPAPSLSVILWHHLTMC